MPDYKRMYTLLCKAVDDALTDLEAIPAARNSYKLLSDALLEAQEIYIDTSPYTYEEEKDAEVIHIKDIRKG